MFQHLKQNTALSNIGYQIYDAGSFYREAAFLYDLSLFLFQNILQLSNILAKQKYIKFNNLIYVCLVSNQNNKCGQLLLSIYKMSKQQQQEVLNTPDFGDQVTFTVGVSYGLGFVLGLGKGIYEGIPKSRRLPRRIIFNNYFNYVGTYTSKYANAFAGAGFLYFVVGKVLSNLFEDQLDELSPLQTNVLCGALTGAVFKSTLGLVPSAFGFAIGAGISGLLHTGVEYGNRNGVIPFEMKF